MKPEQTSELVKLRLEQARSSLNDAMVLAQGGGTAMSIINRAYYAMFYAVLALLQNMGKVAGKHTGAIGLFDSEFVLKGVLPKDL
ncbi:HEPN domain-containing protein [candidate division WOR-3 bacterium]|nr:HEPN domain-containing protein [candidate division WOR-3 bacterium]